MRSRLGGRLEPLSRVNLVLHEGRGELSTVSQVDTRARPLGPARAARLARARKPGVRGGAAPDGLLRAQPPGLQPAVQRARRCSTRDPAAATRAQALAFRAKLLLAAGFAPELSACAACGEVEHLGAFSPSAGGVVCAGCEAGSFPLSEGAHALPGGGAGASAGRGARGGRPRPGAGRPGAGRDARAPRARAPEAGAHRLKSRPALGRRAWASRISPWRPPPQSSYTRSPRARATCATCWAARARTWPR